MASKNILISVTICAILFHFVSTELPSARDPANFYTMIELVCSDGYPIQEYKVVTEDGYILSIYRIPNGNRREKIPRQLNHYQYVHRNYHPDFENCVNESATEIGTGPPVLLVHGLFAASDNFVLQGPGYDLAYLLADSGYDVWFANIRGNFYSKAHISLRPSDPKFWDFSFHENGVYDIPATIDFIQRVTHYPKIFYVGHSMGTTMYFIMMSVRPEYNDKIQLFAGMTPLSQIKAENLSPSRRGLLGFAFKLLRAVRERGVVEFMPRAAAPILLGRSFCGKQSPLQNICYDVIFAAAGYHSKLFLRDKFPLFLSHGLSGNSVKTFTHYNQLLNSPTFRQFDYGPRENLKRYGQKEPPEYDLRKVTSPASLHYSYHDYIVDPKDVKILINNLPNLVEVQALYKYSHVDFMWAYNAKDLVYSKILALMDQYRNQLTK